MNTDVLIDVIILVVKIIVFIELIYISIDMGKTMIMTGLITKREYIIYLIIWQINFLNKN